MPMNDLPRRTLREWREGKFWTQAELAEKAGGLNPHTISDWENGRKEPQFRNIRALATALGIEPEQIIFAKENPVAA